MGATCARRGDEPTARAEPLGPGLSLAPRLSSLGLSSHGRKNFFISAERGRSAWAMWLR